MARYETVHGPLLDDPVCGRPAGHNGPCRSVMSLASERPKDLARNARWKRERRWREQAAGRRAVLAAALRESDGYGKARRAA